MASYSRIYENETKGTWYRKLRFGVVQKPINRAIPNPYGIDYWMCKVSDNLYPTSNPSAISSQAYVRGSTEWDNGFGLLQARCYDSIYREASGGKRAAAGITLLEWRSSLGMIGAGAGSLFRSANAVRKGNFAQALRELNVRDPHLQRRLTRQYGDGRRLDRLWLELNFGWAPLIDDIRQMAAVMGQHVPIERISSSASGPIDWVQNASFPGGYDNQSAYGVKKLRYVSSVVAVNPNINLAKQLGLTNPVQVAWDAVPMSFVVDWFLPVNKFLSSLDLSLGITLGPLVISKQVRVVGMQRLSAPDGATRREHSSQSEFYEFRRSIGSMPSLPSFKSRLSTPTGSLWQAATTAALATTQLIGIRDNRRLSR